MNVSSYFEISAFFAQVPPSNKGHTSTLRNKIDTGALIKENSVRTQTKHLPNKAFAKK